MSVSEFRIDDWESLLNVFLSMGKCDQTVITNINIHRWKSCMLHYTLHDIHNNTSMLIFKQNLKFSWSTFHPRFNMKIIIENFETWVWKFQKIFQNFSFGPPHKKKTPQNFTRFAVFFIFYFGLPINDRSAGKNKKLIDRLTDFLLDFKLFRCHLVTMKNCE